MNDEIAKANRHLTVILDPHIKANQDYFVYRDGL